MLAQNKDQHCFFCMWIFYIFSISFMLEYSLMAAHMISSTYIIIYNEDICPPLPERICIIINTTRTTRIMAMNTA